MYTVYTPLSKTIQTYVVSKAEVGRQLLMELPIQSQLLVTVPSIPLLKIRKFIVGFFSDSITHMVKLH